MFNHFHLCFHCHQNLTPQKKRKKKKNSTDCQNMQNFLNLNCAHSRRVVVFLLHFFHWSNFRGTNKKLKTFMNWTCFVCVCFFFIHVSLTRGQQSNQISMDHITDAISQLKTKFSLNCSVIRAFNPFVSQSFIHHFHCYHSICISSTY